MSTTHAQQDKQASLSDALTKSKEQKKGAPLLDMLSNSDKLMVQKNLPNQIKSEMEEKFNANLDHVKLYESKLVEDTGAHAYAGGASIAFAPGKLDFSSFEGKKLLGHELSHVVNKTSELEADRAGLQVATGESAFSTTASSFDSMESVITPMSGSDGISDFAGPVAAKKPPSSGTLMMNEFNNSGKDDQGNIDEKSRIAEQMELVQKLQEIKTHEGLPPDEEVALHKMLKYSSANQDRVDASQGYLMNKSNTIFNDSYNDYRGTAPRNAPLPTDGRLAAHTLGDLKNIDSTLHALQNADPHRSSITRPIYANIENTKYRQKLLGPGRNSFSAFSSSAYTSPQEDKRQAQRMETLNNWVANFRKK